MYISRVVNYTSSITSSVILTSSIPLQSSITAITIPAPSTLAVSNLLQGNTWNTSTIYGLIFGICSILIGIPGCIIAIRTRHHTSAVSPSVYALDTELTECDVQEEMNSGAEGVANEE